MHYLPITIEKIVEAISDGASIFKVDMHVEAIGSHPAFISTNPQQQPPQIKLGFLFLVLFVNYLLFSCFFHNNIFKFK